MQTFAFQDSAQTLAEWISEYYAANSDLVRGRALSPEAARFFRCHDVAHVVFGCSTELDDEAVVKIASIFGSTEGLRVLKGYRLHESLEIYKKIPPSAALGSITRSAVIVPRTLPRCLRQRARLPWKDFGQYLGVELRVIRQKFGIMVPHGRPTE